MQPYDDALQEILDHGVAKTNKRTGTETLSVFGMLRRYRLDLGHFPLITKRKIFPKSVFAELLWFLSGSTNNKDLQKLGCNFWTPWVDKEFEKKHGYVEGSFGPVYGFSLRYFGGYYGSGADDIEDTRLIPNESSVTGLSEQKKLQIMTNGFSRKYGQGGFDQLLWMVQRIKDDPSCRRILWSLWNPAEVDKMRLPPCHYTFQILIDDTRQMTGILTQRSADYPIGIPANIQFYSALIVMLSQQTNCVPYEMVHVTSDSHIYANQVDAVKEYLSRESSSSPKLTINKAKDILSYSLDDFQLTDYNPLPKIEIPVAV